jgi:hypothetical protein
MRRAALYRARMNARQAVTILGWIWIGLGAMAFVSASGGLMMSLLMSRLGEPRSKSPLAVDVLFEHFGAAAGIQIFLSLILVFAGVHFLKRRNWARIVIQAFSMLGILWQCFFGVIWVRTLWQMKAAANGPSEGAIELMRWAMTAGGTLAMLGPAVLLGSCIWLLNRPFIRQEFTGTKLAVQG